MLDSAINVGNWLAGGSPEIQTQEDKEEEALRQFKALPEEIRKKYAPNR